MDAAAGRVPAVARALASARGVLFALLGASGVLLSFLAGPPSHGSPLRLWHAWTAEALVAVCVAELAIAFASGAYREGAGAWFGRVGLLVLVVVTYVLGSAAGPGEGGQEGMAHLARAIGADSPPAWLLVVGIHVAVASFVALLGWQLRWPREDRRQRAGQRSVATLAVVALALALTGPAWWYARDLPAVDGAEAAHAPWPLRIVSPLETAGDRTLTALALGGVIALAALPLLDRRSGDPAWRRVAAAGFVGGALVFVLMTVLVSFGPPGH